MQDTFRLKFNVEMNIHVIRTAGRTTNWHAEIKLFYDVTMRQNKHDTKIPLFANFMKV